MHSHLLFSPPVFMRPSTVKVRGSKEQIKGRQWWDPRVCNHGRECDSGHAFQFEPQSKRVNVSPTQLMQPNTLVRPVQSSPVMSHQAPPKPCELLPSLLLLLPCSCYWILGFHFVKPFIHRCKLHDFIITVASALTVITGTTRAHLDLMGNLFPQWEADNRKKKSGHSP